jgi:hypothetical protein
MNAAVTSSAVRDPSAVLDRHTTRRAGGVPTVSLLVGPVGAGRRTWRRWPTATGRPVVPARGHLFPHVEWAHAVAEALDLPAAAVRCLALRAGRDPDEFLAAWRTKTPADCDRLWSALAPHADDDVLRALAALAVERVSSRGTVASFVGALGERIVPAFARLAPAALPSVLFTCGSADELAAVAPEAASWAERVPVVPVAVVVPARAWAEYLAAASDSRAKAILREGELEVPVLDAGVAEQALAEAGVGRGAAAAIAANGADGAFVEAAAAVARATAAAPRSGAEDDRARSAAERFLFEFLESLPETAGRFELNAALEFRFGPRPAEVDLLCRDPRIAVEIDGYFHFRDPAGYRRDRAKDWELQRRGYLVLRFLAEDVIPQLEVIRDRILDALARPSPGGLP